MAGVGLGRLRRSGKIGWVGFGCVGWSGRLCRGVGLDEVVLRGLGRLLFGLRFV